MRCENKWAKCLMFRPLFPLRRDHYLKTLIILFCMYSILSRADIFPEGKYMFSAPALYKTDAGQHYEFLCELQNIDNIKHLKFLNGDDCYIDLLVSDKGNIKIVKSKVGLGEVGRKVKGSGRLISNETAKGKMTTVSGANGFLLVQREKSEWCLRPATEEEVVDGLMRGLSYLPNTLYGKKLEPTLENIEKYIFVGEGRGYSFSDRPKIMQMLRDGDLIYTNKKFELKRNVTGEVVKSPPISPEVETEKIPYKSKEELLQIMESFEEDGVDIPLPVSGSDQHP